MTVALGKSQFLSQLELVLNFGTGYFRPNNIFSATKPKNGNHSDRFLSLIVKTEKTREIIINNTFWNICN